jgi:hypothetical protein
LLDRQRIPAGEVVQVLLDDDIAAAREGGVFAGDEGGVESAPL